MVLYVSLLNRYGDKRTRVLTRRRAVLRVRKTGPSGNYLLNGYHLVRAPRLPRNHCLAQVASQPVLSCPG